MFEALLSLSLLSIDPIKLDQAQEMAKVQLVETGHLQAHNMTQHELMVEFLIHQMIKKNQLMMKSIWKEIVKLLEQEEGFDKEAFLSFENLADKMSQEFFNELMGEFKTILIHEFSQDEVELLFAQSIDSKVQMIDAKMTQNMSCLLMKAADFIKLKLEELDQDFINFDFENDR